MSAYLERIRRMLNVPVTYISVCERISIRSHTLIPYAIVRLHFNITKSAHLLKLLSVSHARGQGPYEIKLNGCIPNDTTTEV